MSLRQWWAQKRELAKVEAAKRRSANQAERRKRRITSLIGIVSGTTPCGDGCIRVQAVEELGQFGTEAAAARPYLVKALADHVTHGLAPAAAAALTRIGADETAAPACTFWLSPASASANSLTFAMLLHSLGPKAQAANARIVKAVSGTVLAWQQRNSPTLRALRRNDSAATQEHDKTSYHLLPSYIGVLLKSLCMLEIGDLPRDATSVLHERLKEFVESDDILLLRQWALLALIVHFPDQTNTLRLDSDLRTAFRELLRSPVFSASVAQVELAACEALLEPSTSPTENLETVFGALRKALKHPGAIEALRLSATQDDLHSIRGT